MKKLLGFTFSMLMLVSIFACGGSSGQDDNNNENTTPIVYLSGGSSPTSTYHALYSKDGIITSLSSDVIAVGTGIFVADDVYVSGIYRESSDDKPCYWKGETKVDLDFTGADEAFATGIYISGSDVYVSGYKTTGSYTACYWKNGTINSLSTGAIAASVFVSGGDVYIAGADSSVKPCYWKNGVKVALSSSEGLAYDIKVVNGDVYVAGMIERVAVYWKNGVVTELEPAGDDSTTTSIFVNGSDVYVVGLYQDYTKLAYWKNNAGGKVVLDTGSYLPTDVGVTGLMTWRLPRIAVSNNDVHIVAPLGDGTDVEAGGYWKNGVLSTPTDTIYTSIFIK